ncbi:PREDICTED: uncharacterized protein LOC109179324 [Ipomoea nil]|uniref:uncharacterized protein LOC109179324 n=1 Tax=Ipomoea nil TaxID=35883 RepID=UPI000900A939|nr:PREDICTED: uncharacterized protein LOC109179324 [Ipomoea nil]
MVPDSEIHYSHAPVSFNTGFSEQDDAQMISYDPSTNEIKLRMVFSNFQQLKAAVQMYSLAHRREFRPAFKKAKSWRVVCRNPESIQPPCTWSLSAKSLKGVTDEWIITKVKEPHTCRHDFYQGGSARMCTSALVADLIYPKIAAEPDYKIKHIRADVKQHYGLEITYKKGWSARQKTVEKIYGKFEQSYTELPKFLQTLKSSNPGTVVELKVNKPDTNSPFGHFLYAFWAFKPAIDDLQFCLPVITVDDTHLYGKYKGHLLLAMGRNANREIYPLAYSIVDSENGDSWTWFLNLLATHVLSTIPSVCIISDKHPGIDVAFNNVSQLRSSRVKHRFCLRHIRSNVMTRFKNSRLKDLVWEAGTAVSKRRFRSSMQSIQQHWPDAYNYLSEIQPKAWTLSHDGGHRIGVMTTNASESFNNSLKGCRMLPVTAIATLTFNKLVAMFADRRTEGQWMQDVGLRWPPIIGNELQSREQQANNATVQRFNDTIGLYAVALATGNVSQGSAPNVEVHLQNRTCKCGRWKSDGLPCPHVNAVCNYRREHYDSFVSNVYSIDNYRRCYEGNFFPLDTNIQWTIPLTCFPPLSARRPSHPGQWQTRRFPNEMDFGTSTRTTGRCTVKLEDILPQNVQLCITNRI